MKNYGEKLELSPPSSLDNKNVLVIDDVITDGKTLQTIGKKIKAQYPNSHLFAATCGIFLKKPNASNFAVKKFER
jgi:hypoxanthine-guanine phosphoribosyltransferase